MSDHFVPLEIQSIATGFSGRNGYIVALKEIGGKRKLQIIVGVYEAQALAIAQEKIVTSRPLTHHFIHSILTEFEIQLKNIQIYKYEEGIYYAHVVLEDNFGNLKYLDCRPSDAICLALKMEKPILAAIEVFDDASQKYADMVTTTPKSNQEENLSGLNKATLEKMLKDAIEREDYELAAKIQTELNKRG